MTSQTQQFIELSDIVALRCECRNPECRTVLLLPLSGALNGASQKCPKCKTAWSGYEHASSHEPDIQRFVDSLKYISQLKLGCTLMLEIKNTLGPGASRQQP